MRGEFSKVLLQTFLKVCSCPSESHLDFLVPFVWFFSYQSCICRSLRNFQWKLASKKDFSHFVRPKRKPTGKKVKEFAAGTEKIRTWAGVKSAKMSSGGHKRFFSVLTQSMQSTHISFSRGKMKLGSSRGGKWGPGFCRPPPRSTDAVFFSKFLQVIIWNGESLPSAWGPDGNGAPSDVDAAARPSFLARQWGREGGNHFHLSLLILFHLFFFMPPYYPISRVEKSCSNSCQKLFTVYGLNICKQTILPVLRHRAGRLNGGGPPRHSSDTGQREGNDRRGRNCPDIKRPSSSSSLWNMVAAQCNSPPSGPLQGLVPLLPSLPPLMLYLHSIG